MNFDVLLQSNITLSDIKTTDALKFISELGLEGEALQQAQKNYFEKSILALAKNTSIFTVGEETVLYFEKDKETGIGTIVVRRQFEDKCVSLSFDLVNEIVVMRAIFDGTVKSKEYKGDTKIADIIKGFNTVIKSFQK